MRKLNRFFLNLISCSLVLINAGHAQNSMSNSISSGFLNTVKRSHVIAQAGIYQGTQGKQQYIHVPSLIGDVFNVSKNRDTNGLLGLGYYLDGQQSIAFKKSYKMLYGLNLFYLAQMKVSGTITQEDAFTNLSYDYYVSYLPLFLMARSMIQTNSPKYDVGVDLGIGPDFMFLTKFTEYPINSGTVPSSPFKDTMSICPAATFGLSLKVNNLVYSIPVEIGYRFFYLGKGSFNHTNQVSSSLNTGNTYANALIFSIAL